MESADLERLRRGYEAFAGGHYDEILAMLDPAVELHEEPDLPDARVWQGRDGVEAFFAETRSRWREVRLDVDEIVEITDDAAVVTGILHGTGSISGVSVETPFAHLYESRDGKAIRVRFFFEKQKALAAARFGRLDSELRFRGARGRAG
jgi:ketosteroid isomerase-like protein